MDPLANHQNPIDIDNWFPYFDQHDSPLFRVDALGYLDYDTKFEVLDPSGFPPLEKHQNNNYDLRIQDFDPFEDFSLWGDFLPLLSSDINNESSDKCQVSKSEAKNTITTTTSALNDGVQKGRRKSKLKSRPLLELEEIEKHFGMPIMVAAKELNVGLTALKKRCRELNIKRWPHRKLKSLKSVIHNAKELGIVHEEEIEVLEEHKRMMEKLPDLELTQSTKKLRQACFKATYQKRRLHSPT